MAAAPAGASRVKVPLIALDGAPLRRGSSGPGVRQLQRALVVLGLLREGSVDARFGGQTAKAVRAFRSRHGLPQRTLVGKKTLAAVNAAIRSAQVA